MVLVLPFLIVFLCGRVCRGRPAQQTRVRFGDEGAAVSRPGEAQGHGLRPTDAGRLQVRQRHPAGHLGLLKQPSGYLDMCLLLLLLLLLCSPDCTRAPRFTWLPRFLYFSFFCNV